MTAFLSNEWTGAICAIQDAIVLANWINVIKVGDSVEEVEMKFKEYKSERFPHVMQAYYHSKNNTNLTGTVSMGPIENWIATVHFIVIMSWTILLLSNRTTEPRPPDGSSTTYPTVSWTKFPLPMLDTVQLLHSCLHPQTLGRWRQANNPVWQRHARS